MPSRHRGAFLTLKSVEVTVTRHPDGCVLIYPSSVWESKKRALVALPYSARVLQRIVLGSAVELSIDASGRLLIPAELRALCHLGKEVALVGLGHHFELWNAEKMARLEEQALNAGLSDQAAEFQF